MPTIVSNYKNTPLEKPGDDDEGREEEGWVFWEDISVMIIRGGKRRAGFARVIDFALSSVCINFCEWGETNV
jgi:hypothetical protein